MTKRRNVMKLFAVAAVLAGCEHPTAPAPTPAPAPKVAPKPALAPVATPAPPKQTVRTLPNGRPACGNVSSKSPPPPDCVP